MKTHVVRGRSVLVVLLGQGCLVALGILLFLSPASFAATVFWTGAGGDDLWSNPLNWSGGVLPTSDDDVLINVPGEVSIRMDVPNTTVRRLQCEESFIITDGPFTVTNGASVVNGSFSMGGLWYLDRALAAVGPGTTFTANGPVTNLVRLEVSGGAIIDLPNARDVTASWAASYIPSWSAHGEGSLISLTNLTNVVVEGGVFLAMNAASGGRIDVRRLSTSEGPLRVNAQNPNSLIDLSGRTGLWPGGSGSWSSSLSASDGGTILIPNVTALDWVDLHLSPDANVNIAQLQSFNGGGMTLSSRTNGFSSLTNFSGSLSLSDSRLDWTNFTVLNATNGSIGVNANHGSRIDLSRVTGLYAPNGFLTFSAEQDSTIDLSGVTDAAASYLGFTAVAGSGGRIDLQRMRVPEGPFAAVADGADSVVDLSGFSGEWASPSSLYRPSGVTARDGGSVLISNVTAMRLLSVEIRGDAVVATDQLRSLTEGSITLYSRTNGFSGLTNFSGAIYTYGSRLDLTNFTILYATNISLTISADQGSFIDLSFLTNVVMDPGHSISVTASGGGRIDLRRLNLPDGPMYLSASGEGSLIDISGFNGGWRVNGSINVSSGGTVLMPNVTLLEGVTLSVSDSGNVNLAQLTSIENSSVSLSYRTNDFPALTSFAGSSLYLLESRLELTNVTVLYATNRHLYFRADQNSLIDLSNVTNLISGFGYILFTEAYTGGRIDLRRMPAPNGPVGAIARNPGSLVDLSGFVGLWNGYWSGYGVSASDGGTVAISNVTAMQNITLSISDSANVPLEQLGSFVDGNIYLYSRTNVFTALSNFTGTLRCHYSHAEFPNVTQFDAVDLGMWLSAEYDSVIDFSDVTNATASPATWLSLSASAGGRIELPLLETILAPNLSVVADGVGSVVDLSSLSGLFSDNNNASLVARNGGTILLTDDAMLLAGVAIDFQDDPGGVLPPFLAPSQSLVLYGQPWRSYRIESRDPSDAGSTWTLYKRVPLTEALEIIGPRPPQDLVLRVREFIADPPEVDLRTASEGTSQLILFGVPEQSYRIETKTTLLPAEPWEEGPTTTLTNSFFIYPEAATTNSARFFRAREL